MRDDRDVLEMDSAFRASASLATPTASQGSMLTGGSYGVRVLCESFCAFTADLWCSRESSGIGSAHSSSP